jgi:16S rRNA (guanine966-N2)-methyltransferase
MGFEALSRGARGLISIEENRRNVQAIQENCAKLGFKDRAEVICGDARKVLPLLAERDADVIWADPPYKSQLGESILTLVDKNRLLNPDGIFVIEHATSLPTPESINELKVYDRRKYGGTTLSFYRYDT